MRNQIRNRFKEALGADDKVLAFYEGGSAAFGRDDEYSDLDFGIVVQDDFEKEAAELIEHIMQSIAPIEKKYILPQPTWHGFWQGFFRLKGISPFLMLDICIIKESKESFFTEPELHGEAIIYFDKTGRVGREKTDIAGIEAIIPKRIERIRFISEFLDNFVEKELKRNRLTDAIDLYNNMFLRSWVELLRIKYDRLRFSWGCRYLSFALPAEVYTEVEGMFFVKDRDDLSVKTEIVKKRIKELLEEIH